MITKKCPLVFLVLPVIAAGEETPQAETERMFVTGCLPSGDGYLRTELSGSIEVDVDWPNSGTECDGMPRPDGSGARVRFSRVVFENGNSLVLVFGIEGLSEGAVGSGFPLNVTIIREGRGEFYGTQGGELCQIDVTKHEALPATSETRRPYRIEATGRCGGPVPAVAGDGKVTLGVFEYTGIVLWENPPDETTDNDRPG